MKFLRDNIRCLWQPHQSTGEWPEFSALLSPEKFKTVWRVERRQCHLRCGSKICIIATLISHKTYPRERKIFLFTNIYTSLQGLHFWIDFPVNPHSFDFQWSVKVTKVERWTLQNPEHTWGTKSTELWWKKLSRKHQPLQFTQWDSPNHPNPVLRKSCVDEHCRKQSRWWIQEDWKRFILQFIKGAWSKTKYSVKIKKR